MSYGDIGRQLKIPKSSVFVLYKKYENEGLVETKKSTGRPCAYD